MVERETPFFLEKRGLAYKNPNIKSQEYKILFDHGDLYVIAAVLHPNLHRAAAEIRLILVNIPHEMHRRIRRRNGGGCGHRLAVDHLENTLPMIFRQLIRGVQYLVEMSLVGDAHRHVGRRENEDLPRVHVQKMTGQTQPSAYHLGIKGFKCVCHITPKKITLALCVAQSGRETVPLR